jgi:hypothetical protein
VPRTAVDVAAEPEEPEEPEDKTLRPPRPRTGQKQR